MAVSRQRRRETIDALRAGTVPRRGLDLLAVGMDRFATAVDGELDSVRAGSGVLKAVRGEYGSGKTFSPAGCKSARNAGDSPSRRCRSAKRKRRYIASKLSTVA
jgi:hypothetical protein